MPDQLAAMNSHGVFFKKAIINLISDREGYSMFQEEYAVNFGEPTAIDLIVKSNSTNPVEFLTVECKRAHAAEKIWIFFRDTNQCFRKMRAVSKMTRVTSIYHCSRSHQSTLAVCSDGMEIHTTDKSGSKANLDVLHGAANQLARGFLGFCDERSHFYRDAPIQPTPVTTNVIPVLVTTASLKICDFEVNEVSLISGILPKPPQVTDAQWLVLKHPFALTGDGDSYDFRLHQWMNEDQHHLGMIRRESLYVVHAANLGAFLDEAPWRNL